MKKTQKGFTLLELIITIFMLAMISTLLLANFRKGERVKRVAITVDGIVNLLRLAQNYALAGKQIDTLPCSGETGATEFRVVVDRTTNPPAASILGYNKCFSPVTLDTFKFPAGVNLKTNGVQYTVCNPSCVSTNYDAVLVRFKPPFAKMDASVNNGRLFSSFSKTEITLEVTDGTISKDFTIDGVSGRIGN